MFLLLQCQLIKLCVFHQVYLVAFTCQLPVRLSRETRCLLDCGSSTKAFDFLILFDSFVYGIHNFLWKNTFINVKNMSFNSRAQRIFELAVTANNSVDETKNEGKFD